MSLTFFTCLSLLYCLSEYFMETKYRQLLIDDVSQLMELSEEDFEIVFSELELKRSRRGQILKKAGQSDKVSRYLCEGFIGSYRYYKKRHALSVIYQRTDTVFDERSYRTGFPSDTLLKCISDVIFYEFSLPSEQDILGKHPKFLALAHKLSLRINERNVAVLELSRKGLKKGYHELMHLFPGILPEITYEELGDFFGVSRRTVERFKHDLKNSKP